MRERRALLAVMAVAMFLTAPGHARAAATTDTQVFRTPESGLLANPCGELISFSGEAQWVFHTTETPAGTIEAKGHLNWANFTGIGEETGARYRIVQSINDEFTFDIESDSATTQSNSFTFQLLSLGGQEQSAWLHTTQHLTVTPAGEVTAAVLHQELRCR